LGNLATVVALTKKPSASISGGSSHNTKGKFKNWTIEYAKFTSEELFKIKWPL